MNVQASVAEGPRRAALLVHAMSAHDRDWILSQLDSVQCGAINVLLEELNALGIPQTTGFPELGGGRMIDAGAAVASSTRAQEVSEASALSPMKPEYVRLEKAEPNVLAKWAQEESARLIALLLRVEEWPWQKALLAELGVIKRRQIEAHLVDLAHARVPCKLADSVVSDVTAFVETQSRTMVIQPPPITGFWRGRFSLLVGHKKKSAGGA